MYRLLRYPLAAAAAACLALPATALAGTYTVTQATSSDIAGWSLSGDPGITGCSSQINSNICANFAQPRPLVLVGSSATKAGGIGLWTWTAPATTSVVSGSVTVNWGIAAKDTTAYLKTRTSSQIFDTQPRQHEQGAAQSPGTGTWSIAKSTQAIGVALKTASAVTYGSGLSNQVEVTHLDLTLEDDTPPTLSDQGALANGGWLSGTTPVCVTVSASDAGAGVTEVDLKDDAGKVLDSYAGSAQSAIKPGAPSIDHDLCITPAKLDDGTQTLHVIATDGAGETTSNSFAVKVDNTDPVATSTKPSGTITDVRPAVSVTLDGGPSGIAHASGDLDGQAALVLSGDTLSLTPGTDLSLGVHTVHWSATDGAGNDGSGQFTFTVAAQVATGFVIKPGSRVIDHGHSATVAMQLSGDASAISGQRIDVERRSLPDGTWQPAGSITTGTSGLATLTVKPAASVIYRLTSHSYPSLGGKSLVKVRQQLHLAASAHVLSLGRALRLRPHLLVSSPIFRTKVQIRLGGVWKTISSPRLNTALKVRPLTRGRYEFRATGGGSVYTPTRTSKIISVLVR